MEMMPAACLAPSFGPLSFPSLLCDTTTQGRPQPLAGIRLPQANSRLRATDKDIRLQYIGQVAWMIARSEGLVNSPQCLSQKVAA